MIKLRCDDCGERYHAGDEHVCVVTPVVTEPMANVTTPVSTDDHARVRRWRTANRDRYNAYMREYRAKRKAT